MDLTSLSGISTVVGAAVGLYGGYHLLFGALKVSDAIKDGQGMSMNSGLGQRRRGDHRGGGRRLRGPRPDLALLR